MIEDLAVCLRYKAFLWHMQHDVSCMMSISHWCVSVDSRNVFVLRCTCGFCFCRMGSCVYLECLCKHLTFAKCANLWNLSALACVSPHLSMQGFVYEACSMCV